MTRALLVAVALASGAAQSGFEALRASLGQANDPDARVRAFIEHAGGTPVVEGGTAIFIVAGDPEAPPRILGDFNDWGEAPGAAAALERLGPSGYFFGRVSLPSDARVEYLVASGGEALDPTNSHRVEDFVELHSELRMPGYRPLANRSDAPPVPRGRVVPFDHVSEALGNTRHVYVYLPPGYDSEPRRVYPEAWLERRVEYDVHAGFRRMIISELVPRIVGAYRVANLPARRLVAGGSRGGQAALDLCLGAPQVFGRCGAWAPAVAPRRVPDLIAWRPARARFVLVRALYDERFGPDAPALRDSLAALGAEVVYREAPQGHNLASWPDLMARVLIDTFPASDPMPARRPRQ